MIDIILTEEQQGAVDRISDWLDNNPSKEFKLGGYAGTGKTTVIKALLNTLDKKRIVVSAFTGKAVNVLQKKGVTCAQTLHSLIYDCDPQPGGGIEFYKRDFLEERPDLIIIDESSMLSTELYQDLSSFGKKCLFVGDPGQLEPVGDNPNLMKQLDLVLSKIHRQAAESPIITFANDIRNGAKLELRPPVTGLTIRGKQGFNVPMANDFDQMICAKNKTRNEVNKLFRKFQERPMDQLLEGDKIIILRNNRAFLVFNGMILFVTKVHKETPLMILIDAKDETEKVYNNLPIWRKPFQEELPKEFEIPRYVANNLSLTRTDPPMILADFGYCITCHKSQGSEWPNVLVWDEPMPARVWDMKRWRYTAITRAAENLTYCI